ncbi:MAG: methyltransferase domain-containing protein [Proteobacteria bacterium]|nr:methyltransferase domain-containing protein [Pseudomonadota bacterium]MBU2467849.1 methyltransferase domain-containing protein [Pseudomonadota bacterium]
MSDPYVHGYTPREAQRLGDQAGTLAELLHDGTRYPAGAKVLEAGCGIGAQTRFLVEGSPEAHFTCLDISPQSLAQAEAQAAGQGWDNITFVRGDLYDPPFAPASFDHLFVCFVLEHLARPVEALAGLARLVKPGGSVTVIEGDHGSCYFHPEGPEARRAWQCLIDCQAALGGDSLIGRRVYPLMVQAGVKDVRVSPRAVYCDDSRPAWVEGFVRRTIIPMVQGVRGQALEAGMMLPKEWEKGVAQLHQTAAPEGSFLYTFFKGVGRVAAS